VNDGFAIILNVDFAGLLVYLLILSLTDISSSAYSILPCIIELYFRRLSVGL